MMEIIGTKDLFNGADNAEAVEFLETIADIIALPEFLKLKDFRHHYGTTRYQHCLNVAWYSFIWCRKAGLDYRSAARGAMLHDFFLYDYHTDQPISGSHAEVHPLVALSNTMKHFDTNEVMIDCIVNHMWPVSSQRPLTPEGIIVSAADKYCAGLEFSSFAAETGRNLFSAGH